MSRGTSSSLSERSPWLQSLTGLRWWAALLVVGQHIALASSESCPPEGGPFGCAVLSQGFMHGFVGVTCFFVISGFVLAWSADPDASTAGFWRRRFAKIYPLLLLSNVLDLLITWLTGDEPMPSTSAVIANLFVVQAWVPGSDLPLQMNQVTWSLSCEVFFYLCFPFIFAWLSRLSTRALRILTVGLVFWPGLIYFAATLLAPSAMQDPGFGSQLLYFLPLTRISEFAIGITAALLVKRAAWRGIPVAAAITVVVLAYLAGIPLLPELSMNAPILGAAMVPVFVLLIVSLANADLTGSFSPMRDKVSVLLGNSSYALYLFHLFVAQSLSMSLGWGNSWQILSNVVTIMVFCTLVAWLLYQLVERPMQRLLSPPPKQHSQPSEPLATTAA
ncbi:acyltransferase family protein [Saccharothrix sp. NRRL B-16314]|uniref:acyltransferase family protein n=1 Tax=Saccharothrix sp. NRRL B-16314 TaxID=1463825 RepID=UPI0009DE4CD5|nr:acyltransferase [Saccharothrix sp. NRRL B-16314]